ncbi:MAG: hypothetical protein WCS84_13085, partial [Nocardioides sp.]
MSAVRRVAAGVVTVLLTTALAACVRLPESGPVVEAQPPSAVEEPQAAAIDAVPPRPGDLPPGIVNGFLDAMTAYPVRTSVAREFLAQEAQSS